MTPDHNDRVFSALPADQRQQLLCRMEVDRIKRSGEVYHNGSLNNGYLIKQEKSKE